MNYEMDNARMWTPRGYLALRLRIIPISAKYTHFERSKSRNNYGLLLRLIKLTLHWHRYISLARFLPKLWPF